MRILLIRAGRIGDTIFAAATMEALNDYYQMNCQFDWLVSHICKELFLYAPQVAKVHTIKHRKLPLFVNKEKQKLVKQLSARQFDLIINLENDKFFDSMINRIPAHKKIGRPDQTLAKRVQIEHAVISHLRFLHFLDPKITINKFSPKLYGPSFAVVQSLFNLPDYYVVLSAANSHTHKNQLSHRAWPIPHWQQLITLLAERGIPVVLVGSTSDLEIGNQLIIKPQSTVINLIGKTSLPELISIISHAKVLVTTDTGTVHIGAATQTPLVALYGASDAKNTGPYLLPDQKAHVLEVQRRNDFTQYLPTLDKTKALAAIKPSMVLAAMDELRHQSVMQLTM